MGLVEGPLARLVDHRLAGNRRELGNDGMSRLDPDQDAAHRPLRADPKRRIAALELRRRHVGQIRAMAFAGMDDQAPALPPRLEDCATRRDRRRKPRYVVAERLAEPAGFEEIALHVD